MMSKPAAPAPPPSATRIGRQLFSTTPGLGKPVAGKPAAPPPPPSATRILGATKPVATTPVPVKPTGPKTVAQKFPTIFNEYTRDEGGRQLDISGPRTPRLVEVLRASISQFGAILSPGQLNQVCADILEYQKLPFVNPNAPQAGRPVAGSAAAAGKPPAPPAPPSGRQLQSSSRKQ